MVSVLACRLNSLVLSPGQEICVVFLGKTLLTSQYLPSLTRCINGYQHTVLNIGRGGGGVWGGGGCNGPASGPSSGK